MADATATLPSAPQAAFDPAVLHSARQASPREALVATLPSFALSRLLLIVLTGIAAVIRQQSPLVLWDQWDSKWYLGIAAHGYHWSLDGRPAIAFFPLYPLLVRAGTSVGLPGIVTALLVSNVAFAGALFYLYRLTLLEWGQRTARRAVWLVALFPTAFFTFAPYTESLFLLCAAASLYHSRKHESAATGFWLAAALMTRSTGVILLPAILIILASGRRASLWRTWSLALSPTIVAAACYAWYLSRQHIALTQILTAQRAWHRGLTYLWTGFTASLDWLVRHGPDNIPFALEDVLQLAVTICFLALTVAAWRKLSRAAAVYCASFWLVVLCSPQWLDGFYAPLSSMDRFVLALFPLAGWAATHLPISRFRATIIASGLLMVGSAAVHLAGGWVG